MLDTILPEFVLSYGHSDDDPIYLSKEFNYNDCDGLSNGELADEYIGYGIHDLYDHTEWSLQDILNIDYFWVEVQVRYQHFEEKV
ncbi:hypothetical protein AGMMS4956_14830 [Bacteroidia bacterium]|nr:hypothetical protein AGMMS4956_14830 [Bacteroidia bacterium]